MAASELVFRLVGIDAGATRTVERLGAAASTTAAQLETIGASSATTAARTTAVLGKVGKTSALIAAGVAVAGVKMAGDFEQSTNVLVTAAGELPKNLGHIRDGILDIASSTGTAWQQVVDSVYDAEKAGFRNNDALKISTAAAEAAREENAKLSTVTDGLTRALTAYKLTGDDAVRTTNALKTGAGTAHATFEEYSAGVGSFLSRAANAKISLPDALGVYSSLTQQESAQQAGQNLGSTISRLAALNGPQQQIFGQLGINVVDFQNKLGDGPGGRGLIGSLNLLSTSALNFIGGPAKGLLNTFNQSQLAAGDADTMFAALPPAAQKLAKGFEQGTEGVASFRKESRALPGEMGALAMQWYNTYQKAHGFQAELQKGGPVAQNYLGLMKKLTGGQEGLTTALAASGMQAGATDGRIKAINKSFTDGSKDVEGWASTQKLFNVQFDQFKQTAERVAIEIGMQLLPPLKALFGFLASHKSVMQDLAYGVLAYGAAWTAVKIGNMISTLATFTARMFGMATATQAAATAQAELAASSRAATGAIAAEGAAAGAGVGAAGVGRAGAAAGGAALFGMRGSTVSSAAAGAEAGTVGRFALPAAGALVRGSSAVAGSALAKIAIPIGLIITGVNAVQVDQKVYQDIQKGHWSDAISKALSSDIVKGVTGGISDGISKAVKSGNPLDVVKSTLAYKGIQKVTGGGDLKVDMAGSKPLLDQLNAEKTDANNKALVDYARNVKATSLDVADLTKSYHLNWDQTSALYDANRNWIDVLNGLGSQLNTNNRTFQGNSQAARENRTAIAAATLQDVDHAESVYKMTGNLDDANATFQAGINTIANNAAALGFNKQQVIDYVAKVLGIPPQRVTQMLAPGLLENLTLAQQYLSMLQQIATPVFTEVTTYYKSVSDGNPINLSAGYEGGGSSSTGHSLPWAKATGGIAKGWGIVGERGPEMINLGSTSMVMNHRDSMNALGVGSGDVHNHFYINAVDAKSFKDLVNQPANIDAITNAAKRRARP